VRNHEILYIMENAKLDFMLMKNYLSQQVRFLLIILFKMNKHVITLSINIIINLLLLYLCFIRVIYSF